MRNQRTCGRALAAVLFVATAGLTSIGPSPAEASPLVAQGYGAGVTLTGHGFGHGIGLSQVGAYGYAV